MYVICYVHLSKFSFSSLFPSPFFSISSSNKIPIPMSTYLQNRRRYSRERAFSSLARGSWTARTNIRKMRKMHFSKNAFFENAFFENAFFENFANFWRARSRLYQNEILQENMRSTAFFKLYKICILLHRCNLKIFAKNRFEKTAIFVKFQQKNCKCRKICKILSKF